jgi:hypothetical protein
VITLLLQRKTRQGVLRVWHRNDIRPTICQLLVCFFNQIPFKKFHCDHDRGKNTLSGKFGN